MTRHVSMFMYIQAMDLLQAARQKQATFVHGGPYFEKL